GSTIDFNGPGAQTIPAFVYNNLTSSNTGARTLQSSGIIKITASFTSASNAYTVTGSTVEYNGTSAQSMPASVTTYNNLTINNSAGVSLGATTTANGVLNFTTGNLTTGSQTM